VHLEIEAKKQKMHACLVLTPIVFWVIIGQSPVTINFNNEGAVDFNLVKGMHANDLRPSYIICIHHLLKGRNRFSRPWPYPACSYMSVYAQVGWYMYNDLSTGQYHCQGTALVGKNPTLRAMVI